ncbi:hypothetical protein LTR09_009964 [Extremus antarcticus]|uniref:Uncharacterized protein n=1 Tax=Extremus antarcticus TaxID=702011 RepID=A0AAJ0D884_9PEZI|nr:hypothetical protein LTR09_009964 [Extremus antarcticus]
MADEKRGFPNNDTGERRGSVIFQDEGTLNTNGSSLSSLTTAQQNARRASQILRQTRLESRRLSNAERQNTTKIFTRIKNPLVGVPREALLQDVEEFARANNLNDVLPLLKKGAIAAQVQYAEAIQALPELDEDEKQNLAEEITHKWRHPAILYFTIILNSIAAAIQGWDQTGSNGANLSWPTDLGIPDSPESFCLGNESLCAKNSWLIGLVNSMPYFAIFLL